MAETLSPDLCIIGAGPAGLAAAEAARALDASVVLVERDTIGGGGLHAGAIASKALNAAARQAENLRMAERFGVAADHPRVHFGRVRDGIAEVVRSVSPGQSAERFKALGVQIVSGPARFIDARTLDVAETVIKPRRFILATGSRAALPAIPGLDTVPYFTTETIFANEHRLKHLLVLGADAVALEIAQSYRRLGCDVTIVSRHRPLADHDPELADVALRRVGDDGVVIRSGFEVASVQNGAGEILVRLQPGQGEDGGGEELAVSHLLVAGGRAADLDGLDLGKARIGTTAGGNALQMKPNLKTTNRRVYAVGDATGGPPYANIAVRQAQEAVVHALLGVPMRPSGAVARAVFTDPEIAEVGISEAVARKRFKTKFVVVRASFAENGRAQAERTPYGVAKLVCDSRGTILGAGLVGPGAGELIALFALAVSAKLPVSALGRFVAPYPTLSGIAAQLVAQFNHSREPGPLLRRRMALLRRLP